MEVIFVQIPEFIDRETNVHRKCSTVLRGNKILASNFLPYFSRSKDEKFVDRATNAWKKFLFKFQNSSIERQTFVERDPWLYVETKNCLAVFGHIFVIIGTTTLLIERRMRGSIFCSNSRIR